MHSASQSLKTELPETPGKYPERSVPVNQYFYVLGQRTYLISIDRFHPPEDNAFFKREQEIEQ